MSKLYESFYIEELTNEERALFDKGICPKCKSWLNEKDVTGSRQCNNDKCKAIYFSEKDKW